jgi:hypothetical protein
MLTRLPGFRNINILTNILPRKSRIICRVVAWSKPRVTGHNFYLLL